MFGLSLVLAFILITPLAYICTLPPREALLSSPAGPFWAAACHHASDVINMMARSKDKPDMHSPSRQFDGRALFARLLLSLKRGFHYQH